MRSYVLILLLIMSSISFASSPIEQCDNSTVQQTHQCSSASSSYVQVDDAPLSVPVYKFFFANLHSNLKWLGDNKNVE